MGHKKRVLLKKIRNHLQPLKLQKKQNFVTNLYNREAGFRKAAHTHSVRNSELFRIWSKKL